MGCYRVFQGPAAGALVESSSENRVLGVYACVLSVGVVQGEGWVRFRVAA